MDIFFFWFPFWTEVKIAAVYYAFYSDHKQEAAASVMDKMVTPQLEAQEDRIDEGINELRVYVGRRLDSVRDMLSDVSKGWLQKGLEIGSGLFLSALTSISGDKTEKAKPADDDIQINIPVSRGSSPDGKNDKTD